MNIMYYVTFNSLEIKKKKVIRHTKHCVFYESGSRSVEVKENKINSWGRWFEDFNSAWKYALDGAKQKHSYHLSAANRLEENITALECLQENNL